jgi:hypothetical protein
VVVPGIQKTAMLKGFLALSRDEYVRYNALFEWMELTRPLMIVPCTFEILHNVCFKA